MSSSRILLAGAVAAAFFAGAAGPVLAEPIRVAEPIVVAPRGSDPSIALDRSSKEFFVAFVRPGAAAEAVVARLPAQGGGALAPVVVSAGDADILSSAVDPARVAVGPKGEVYALYRRRVASEIVESGRGILRLARSMDGGRSFAAPVDVVADGVETSVGMADLAIAPDGAPLVAWLDSRDAFARARLPEDQRPKDVRYIDSDDPAVELRIARSPDGGASFAPSALVARGASERSHVALALGPDGAYHVSWRAKLNLFKGSYDSVRDVLTAASTDGGASWSSPIKVHDDRFKAGACPELTHGLGVDAKGRVHVAWYTGSGRKPGVFYAVAEPGKGFSEPVTLLSAAWIPYADVKLAVDASGAAWVAYEDRREDASERVALVRLDAQGKAEPVGSWPGRSPDLAAREEEALLVWNSPAGDVRLVRATSK
ncbi:MULTISPECIES: sialidase family protein [Methylosinus]|uniref:Exo-alpha-sialidase n=1 Tax=Methylosinus trichosporium (strain ATCC 35070 / NCIMB 11131 / UNIQEM 75 / OB3b) TaxID=595536 RepID=A0A2D2CX80_METT3|nr:MULTISPECIES: sialidase family protein [Methylosinus]ATQ67304.1 exo-alpha-sialidase [Methylosinus trichosporium OB3b]OBS52074.1 hypothetical protein A8B73_12935 [Methylosinus sp. 3S-1]